MQPNESVAALRAFAVGKGIELDASTSREGILTMLEFGATAPCDGCIDDVLLYQWGNYDWGSGTYFELNITRQFIEADPEGDDAISQLSLTYRYKPTAELEQLEAGNCWSDGPADFHQFILASAPLNLVGNMKPDQVELTHSYV